MLKIHKGLHKKKKKGKKSKKDEEEFDKEELEKYRREHQGEASQTANQAVSGSDEWRNFTLLTSGVDEILKKTQDDLTRIKESSFFQRKPAGVVDLTKDPAELAAEEERKRQEAEAEEHEKDKLELPEGVVEVSDVEDDAEGESDPEDIFDTAYVDVAVAGDLKLAYIPDSPVEELKPGEPDPFDTSIVDKVLPKELAKKAVFNLGSAVDVLAGKADPQSAVHLSEEERRKHRRRIVKPVNLLLESFDTEDTAPVVEETVPQKTLLDDDPLFDGDVEVVTPIVEALKPIGADGEKPTEPKVKPEDLVLELLNELDPVSDVPVETNLTFPLQPEEEEELEDEFAALAAERKERKSSFEEVLGDDPFDTTFVANLIPGKAELKLIESEILNAQIDDRDVVNNKKLIFDGNNLQFSNIKIKINANSVSSIEDVENLDHSEVSRPLSFQHRDLLGGSTTDLSKIGHDPLEPKANSGVEEITYTDPFDVSAVEQLTAPGKAELKVIEKELLESKSDPISQLDDDDFDPRAEESTKPDLKRPDQLFTATKRASVPKIVAFKVESPTNKLDLLTAVDQEEESKVNKPLTPYYPDPKDLEERKSFESDIVDPFDTSHVANVPGKCEIKLLEEELKIHETFTDNNFNPREVESAPQVKVAPPTSLPIKPEPPADILTADEHIDIKLHTPVAPQKPIAVEENSSTARDPFDTSIAENILPGKAEIKLLENELLADSGPKTQKLTRSYTDEDFDPRDKVEAVIKTVLEQNKPVVDFNAVISESHPDVDHKPLTPIVADSIDECPNFDDPFDTSNIDIGPTKTEIKLIESELFKS
ncbi:protein stoned-A [Bemisia tabaci]|uniref:protein stoned-A n=1 Tax=Bemisia tabaci TaxID=7038 RepID=UPI003B27C8A1